MAKERAVSKEQILYLLINLREQEAKGDIYNEIIVNAEKCKNVGIFYYTIKDTGERRSSELFLINETHNGEEISILYDEKGRFIAWKKEEELQISQDIVLNPEQLERQIQQEEEKEEHDKQQEEEKNGEDKAGEGRDLADKEHEEDKEKEDQKEKEKKKDKKEDEKEEEKNEREGKLENFKGKINIDYSTKVRLDQVINGYYLWQLLQIEDKYKGKMPEGLSEKNFRYGYLTVIDSAELQAQDGKERPLEKTFAICTRDGDIIELDDTILEPVPTRQRDLEKEIEQTSVNYRDGKEADRPKSELQNTRKSMYKIKDVDSRFAVVEDNYLSADMNRDYKLNGKNPLSGNIDEISYVQTPKMQSIYEREMGMNSLVNKLEAINEPTMDAEELKQNEGLKKKDANEALNTKAEHTQELVEECKAKYPDYGEIYNESDLREKVQQYHNNGMNDEEVLEQVGADIEYAKMFEHEFYIHGRRG